MSLCTVIELLHMERLLNYRKVSWTSPKGPGKLPQGLLDKPQRAGKTTARPPGQAPKGRKNYRKASWTSPKGPEKLKFFQGKFSQGNF
jgi:hypothetical protein